MLKIPLAKTATFFLAASTLALTPPASIAYEDCGTTRTECELRQQIKDLQQQNQAQQRQIEELKAAQFSLRQKTDAISVSSGGNVGIGTTKPGGTGSKLDVVGGNIAVDGQAALASNNETIYVGDLASGDGVRGLILRAGDSDRLTITKDGRVGIGTIRGHNVTPSDQRLKQNIHPLDNALTKLQGLRGVNFEWKKSQDQEAGTQIGLIAQEVEGVLPELVSTDGDGYKSIAYGQLSAVLIEAVKEQQQIIEQKSATIAELQLSLQEQQKENAALQDNQAAQAERIASLEAMMQGMTQQMAAMTRQMEAIKAAVPQPVKTRLH
jgi:prefoldin subunit 5